MRAYDVVIIGAGIAGGLLARQLRLARPELSVIVLEAVDKLDDYKVGESTVEVAANYMIRRLNLGTYLYQHQLPKNGLRFFFDSEDRDLPLHRMSEIGSDHMPFHPSFQLERARLERDLVTLNREAGAEVELGAKVTDLKIDGKGGHTVTYDQAGERREITCRWLCDASGRRHVLLRKLGVKVQKETRLNTAAAWARYRNVAGLDAVRDEAWRTRVRWTSRHLSTNHLMYDGYWIWFIPLAGDLMSVGVVYDKDRIGEDAPARPGLPVPRGREAFERFLEGHRAVRELLVGAEMEDFQGYAHLPYRGDLFFSTDRIALTGEAGAFVDPFYSPGSDFIATANEFITRMILTEVDGRRAELEEQVAAYDAYYRFKYESTLLLYSKMYPIFGSFDLFRLKYLLDFNNYYNLVLWPFVADRLTDVGWIREELKFTDLVLRALSTMADHFSKLGQDLHARGEYFAKNEGRWANGLNGVVQLQRRITPVLDPAYRRAQVDRAYGSVFASLIERRLGEAISDRERVISELTLPQVLVFKDITPEALARLVRRIGDKMAKDLRAELPEAGVEQVKIGTGGAPIEVIGPEAGSEVHARALARAQALWDASAGSLTHVAL